MEYWKALSTWGCTSMMDNDQQLNKCFLTIIGSLGSKQLNHRGPASMLGLRNALELRSLNLWLIKKAISAIVTFPNNQR